jgi:hypothetical protein
LLGNCILRDPRTANNAFNKGALCEALLFFGKVHLALDIGTLHGVIQAGFFEDLISLLKAGFLTANYSPQSPAIHTDTKLGMAEHIFTVIKITGDQKNPKMRNPQLMEQQLGRLLKDKTEARKKFRALCDLISFNDVGDNGVPELGRKDILDRHLAAEVARRSLREKGIPDSEIKFTYLEALPLADNRFAIATDMNIEHLRTFLPEAERKQFGPKDLFVIISEARWDIGLAASQNAAFVGNDRNEEVTNLILSRSLGVRFDGQSAARQIYDFISVATPSVRDVINEGTRTVSEFLALLEKSSVFRAWLEEQNPTADLVKEMLREKSSAGWLDSTPVKLMRFGLFTGAGMLADLAMPGTSVVTGAMDSFVVEKIVKRWRPHFFVENSLKGFLERMPPSSDPKNAVANLDSQR